MASNPEIQHACEFYTAKNIITKLHQKQMPTKPACKVTIQTVPPTVLQSRSMEALLQEKLTNISGLTESCRELCLKETYTVSSLLQ